MKVVVIMRHLQGHDPVCSAVYDITDSEENCEESYARDLLKMEQNTLVSKFPEFENAKFTYSIMMME